MTENNKHLVFTYGTLMSGMPNNRILVQGGARLEGTARLKDHRLMMLEFFNGAYPALVHHGAPGVPIVGEVWMVDDKTLDELDRLEGTTRHYERRMNLATMDADGSEVMAWIYVLSSEFVANWTWGREKVVVGNDWRAWVDGKRASQKSF